MSETRFTAEDLEPSDEEKLSARRVLIDQAAVAVAVLAAGIWMGGMIALGACAAPFVFRLTPDPYSGEAMGAAFARFDQIAIGAAVIMLGAEVARTWAQGPRGRSAPARVRRLLAILMAAGAVYSGLVLTPSISGAHRAGVRQGIGPEGAELSQIHKRASTIGKVEIAFGVALVALHVFTLRARRPEDDDDDGEELAPGPLPPGPRS
jgi:uncharacterized membrane protein